MLRARLASVVLETVDTVRELVGTPTQRQAAQWVGAAAAVAAAATKAIVTMRVAGMARGGAYKPTVVAAAMAPVPSLNEAAVADAASTEATRTGKASRQALVAEVEQVVAQEMETVTAVTLGTYKEKEADVAVAAAWAIGP
jgi:hypothetical protein